MFKGFLLFQFVSWKGKGSIPQSAEDYLVFHKFGHVSKTALITLVDVHERFVVLCVLTKV